MRYLLVLGIAFSFFGCGEEFDSERPEPAEQKTSVSIYELKEHVSVVVENGTEPERYVVHFGWPRIVPLSQVRVKTDRVLGVVKADQTLFSHTVSHNQLITYVFEVIGSTGEVVDKFVKKVSIPTDLVVSEATNPFTEDKYIKLNRLYLNEHPLRTNGYKVTIDVNEIYAKSGVIESFPEGARAKDNTDGRGAGELIINSKYARGEMKIFMRGEDGGNGSKGAYKSPAAGGYRGSPGSFLCDSPVSRVNLDELDLQRGRFCGCERMGSDGGPGTNGEKGNDGLPGKNGGDSGFAKVTIQNGAELRIETFSIPGKLGKGGNGGDGQAGGPGGPGAGDRCSGGKGPDGSSGASGKPGSDGLLGKKGTFCTYIASERFNECDQ